MTIHSTYRLHCTRCNKEYDIPGCTEKEVLGYASEVGWIREKVENGSEWDYCPQCQART